MIIGYLTSQYPATSHTFIRREINALQERGFDIRTYSVRKPSQNERENNSESNAYQNTWYILPPRSKIFFAHISAISVHPVRYFRTFIDSMRHRVPGFKATLMPVVYFIEAIYLAHELKQQQVSHLHNHFANPAATVGYLASRFLSISWSLTLHGHSDCDYPSSFLLPEKIEYASFVACAAHFTRSQAMLRVAPTLWPKLFVNRCGVDLKLYQSRLDQPIATQKIRILCIARLSPEKGLTGLVQAFSILSKSCINTELRIVGEGPDRARIEEAIREADISHSVSLPGRIPESGIAKELEQADIFTMSSFMEGLPVSIMEAMAMGVPVIAPNTGGISELVEHQVTGLLFSPGNWQQLAESLQTICANTKLRHKYAEEGKQRIQAFDMKQVIEPIAQRFTALPAHENANL